MATSATEGSTPRLSEVARHVVIPKGIVTTAWPRVVAKCEELGVTFDPWQHGIGTISLGKRKNGKYAATVGGIVLSIPRQVGKTFLVGMIIIALCLLHPGYTVLWTAHRTRTATKTFASLKGMTSRKRIAPHMLEPRNANGEQEIRFRNGSVIMFGAREQGFGRGFDEVDVEVFDEGQILTEKGLEDMVPAANQSRHPAGALLFFMGTPPRPTDPGEEFANRRAKALAGETDDTVYVEFSADEDADCDDREQWAKANPSFPSRTPLESMLRMRAQLTDESSFKREALGIWDKLSTPSPVNAATWAQRTVSVTPDPAVSRVAYSLDMSEDRAWVAVSVAAQPESGGPAHVECVFHEPTDRVMDDGRTAQQHAVSYLVDRKSAAKPVIVAASSNAMSLVPDLQAKHVVVQVLSETDVSRACGRFLDAVKFGQLTHFDQGPLNLALTNAKKSDLGKAGGWVWDRRRPSVDISPLVSVTLALFGVAAHSRVTGRGRVSGARSTSNRTAVLL